MGSVTSNSKVATRKCPSAAGKLPTKAALARARAVLRPLRRQHLMIATLGSAIGWQAGASQRRTGAARIMERAALRLQEDAHEHLRLPSVLFELINFAKV